MPRYTIKSNGGGEEEGEEEKEEKKECIHNDKLLTSRPSHGVWASPISAYNTARAGPRSPSVVTHRGRWWCLKKLKTRLAVHGRGLS